VCIGPPCGWSREASLGEEKRDTGKRSGIIKGEKKRDKVKSGIRGREGG